MSETTWNGRTWNGRRWDELEQWERDILPDELVKTLTRGERD